MTMDAIGYVMAVAVVGAVAALMAGPRIRPDRHTVAEDEPDASPAPLPTVVDAP